MLCFVKAVGGPKSESGGTKNWKNVKGGMQGFGTPIFEMEKNQGIRCTKPFENLMRVSGSKLLVSTARLKKKWPQQFSSDSFNNNHYLE